MIRFPALKAERKQASKQSLNKKSPSARPAGMTVDPENTGAFEDKEVAVTSIIFGPIRPGGSR